MLAVNAQQRHGDDSGVDTSLHVAGIAPLRSITRARPRLTPPSPRGPLSAWVLGRLAGRSAARPAVGRLDAFDDDLQVALYCCYEPHFSDLPGVVGEPEWDPELLTLRQELESAFERGLREVVAPPPHVGSVRTTIPAMIGADDGPSLSTFMEGEGTRARLCELVVHRSAYQLKEADGHTLGIPRLAGRAKQLLARIQAGEYGVDADDRTMHAELFARTMSALGLDPRPNAYLDVLPGSALAISNIISMFGLHRRWRGALVGHLAVFEMTSVEPMGRYSRALARLGAGPDARRFYDVHVLADAEHEAMALDMATALAATEPALAVDVVFGASCAIAAERRFTACLLERWSAEAGSRA